jgi:hypothetical protein
VIFGVLILAEVYEYNKKLEDGFKITDVEKCRDKFLQRDESCMKRS